MNWYGNRYEETYEYVKVSPIDWKEYGAYDYITSGSIEMSDENSLKITGSFQFEGLEEPDVNYMLRVYYSFVDDGGEYIRNMMATLYVSFSSLMYTDTLSGMKCSGTLTGNSVLTLLENKIYGQPFIIKKNENAIYKAAQLIQEFGLRVEYTPSSKVLSADHTFSSGTDYLEIVRWCCELAGYSEPYPDEEGVIQLQPINKPEQTPQSAKVKFTSDEYSIVYPELETENDWQEKANVVKLVYNTDKASMVATSKNLRGSRSSLESVNNREITMFEDVGELGSTGSLRRLLMASAELKLRQEAREIETVTFSHAWIPMYLHSVVDIDYGEFNWVGLVENMSIELQPGTKVQTKIDKTIDQEIEVDNSVIVYIEEDGNE